MHRSIPTRSWVFIILVAAALLARSVSGQTLTTLVDFDGSNGSSPYGTLIQATDGNFYGTTYTGGAGDVGTVFKVTPEGTLTTLVEFDDDLIEGIWPMGGVVQGSDGNFYGTTSNNGHGGYGTIFKVTSEGIITTLVSFNSTNGANPSAGLVQGVDGNFYGTTYIGGKGGETNGGVVFRMTPAGTITNLKQFTHSSSSGYQPFAPLIRAANNVLYGSTESGGVNDDGIIFQIATNGAVSTKASFSFSETGATPEGALTQGSDGNFYGTTYFGGATGQGMICKMTAGGLLTGLVSFNGTNGARPNAGLVQGADGNFYGVAQFGGATNRGTLFKVTTAGVLTKLLDFTGENGANPYGGLVQGNDGYFYGTTSGGGLNNAGTIFRFDPAPPAPVITAQPISQTVTLGTAVSFSVTATNTVSLTYQWQKNGTNISGATTSRLAFSNAATTNAASYSVVVSNGSKSTTSETATLTVVLPPIPSAPTGVTASALAPNLASVSWKKSSTNETGFTVFRAGTNSGTFTSVTNVSASVSNYLDRTVHSGLPYYYVVKAYNGSGSSSNSAVASVTMPVGLADTFLFQNPSGPFSLWVMNQTNFLRYASITNGSAASTGWRVAALADINGDLNSDVLWQNTSGQIMTWLMIGTNRSKVVNLKTGPAASTGWKIVSAPDLTGDGKADFLWLNTNGATMFWTMNGTNFVSQSNLRTDKPAGTGWTIACAADLDGNLSSDIVWATTNGLANVWLMNKTNRLSAVAYTNTGWKLTVLTDLNADRKKDFVWEKTDGRLQTWLMNGTNRIRIHNLRTNSSAISGWRLIGPK